MEVVGNWLTVIVTFDVEGVHGLFEIVHANTLFPTPNPVTEVLGRSEFVITPEPETKVHAPVPTTGKFPFIVVEGDEIQSV